VEGEVIGLTPPLKITPTCGIWLTTSSFSPARTLTQTIPAADTFADERLLDAEAQPLRVSGEAEPLADRRHRLRPGKGLDDACRAVEDGAGPAGGPRTRRDYDATRRVVLGAPPVPEVVAGRDVGLPSEKRSLKASRLWPSPSVARAMVTSRTR